MSCNPFSLEGKTILITGAAGGIGSETARVLVGLGARLVLTDIREEPLQNVLESLSPVSNGNHIAIPSDLTDETSLKALVENCPSLDGLVCNAGVMRLIPVPFITNEEL